MDFFCKPARILVEISTRLAYWLPTAAFVIALPLAGCGDRSAVPVADRNRSADAADSEVAGRPAEVSTVADNGRDRSDSAADRCLAAMLRRYREATGYRDTAVVRLTYREEGRQQTDTAPLQVGYRGPDALRVDAYTLQMVCLEGRMQARVTDPASQDFDRQRVERSLPDGALTFETLYADPLLAQFASSGLAGPPPQLELLLGKTPLQEILTADARRSLIAPADLDGAACHRLQIELPRSEARFVLWIDSRESLLRRIELPRAMVPELASDRRIQDAVLSVDFQNAAFKPPPDAWFQLPRRSGARVVEQFVPPPPPPASPLLATSPSPFGLQIQTAEGERIAITESGSDRPQTVLLWVARHEGSQAATESLHELASRLADPVRRRTRFAILMAEPNPNTESLFRNWQVTLPWGQDRAAVGRDVFQVQAAPAICVLGKDGRIEWLQQAATPAALDKLPKVLRDLAGGVEVGQAIRDQDRRNQAAYRRAIGAD